MRNFSSRSKRIWSFIGVIMLIVLAVTLILSLIPKKTDDGYKEVRTDWAVGSLVNGIYQDDHSISLVSDYVKINEGFQVVIDFDKECSVGYVLYDAGKEVIGEGTVISLDTNFTVEDFDGQAKYVRFLITNLVDEDNHISTLEKWEYSNYITIYTLEETEDE